VGSGAASFTTGEVLRLARSRAFLALGAADVSRDGFDDHRAASLKLLDDAARAYKDALTQTAELQRADAFLRSRPFDRLRSAFGITPGTTPAMLRRALTSWFSALSHGALVSDAFDSLVR